MSTSNSSQAAHGGEGGRPQFQYHFSLYPLGWIVTLDGREAARFMTPEEAEQYCATENQEMQTQTVRS